MYALTTWTVTVLKAVLRVWTLLADNRTGGLHTFTAYNSCDVTTDVRSRSLAEEGPEVFGINLVIACAVLVALAVEFCMCR